MNTLSARTLLLTALGLGVAVDVLFDGAGIGVNVPLLTVLVLAGSILTAGQARVAAVDRADAWLPVAALGFAVAPAVRADPWLVALDLAMVAALLGLWIAALGGARITRGTAAAVLGSGLAVTAAAGAGAFGVVLDARPGDAVRARRVPPSARPIARGLLLATPVVLVFVSLFAAADAVFAQGLERLVDLRLDLPFSNPAERLLVVAAAGWVFAGILAVVVGSSARVEASAVPDTAHWSPVDDTGSTTTPADRALRLGEVEAVVVLVTVGLLFATFAALQVAYLFGGRDTLAASGLTYAEYARRGFFELLAVAGLAGSLVAVLEAVAGSRSRRYRLAAVAVLALNGVVLASAFLRLRLYQEAYGWTELRFWVLLAIGWVAAGLLASGLLVIADRSRRLGHALAGLGIVALVVANVVGPGGFVAERNLERAIAAPGVPPGLDAWYLAGLGDDAVPAIVAALPRLRESDRVAVIEALRDVRHAHAGRVDGWASWNLSRQQARDLLAGVLAE